MTLQSAISTLAAKMKSVFEEKGNKTTSWGETLSDTKYPSEKLVKNSLDAKESVSNKVTSTADWSSTTSDDKYPSEKLVKSSLDAKEATANKVTSWSGTVSDTNYPSEKLVKNSLNEKLDKTDVPSKTSDLTNDGADGEHPFLTEHQSLDSKTVTVEKLSTAETGYAHSYVVKQNNAQVGATINIPKDYLVKSATVDTVTSADLSTLGTGYEIGDKYMDFVVNTKGNDGTDEHIYVNVKDLVEDTTYTADGTTLDLTSGEFSIADSGVNTTQLADSAVTTAKINGKAVTTAKIDDKAVTASQIADNTITASQIATSLSDTWLDSTDVDGQIEDAIEALTAALD